MQQAERREERGKHQLVGREMRVAADLRVQLKEPKQKEKEKNEDYCILLCYAMYS